MVESTDVNSVRDIMKDRIKDVLNETNNIYSSNCISDLDGLVNEITDEAFSVCGIPEKEQNEKW